MFLRLIILLIINSNIFAKNDINSFINQYKKADLRAAQSLIKLYKNIDHLKAKDIKHVQNSLKKSKLFSNYNEYIAFIKKNALSCNSKLWKFEPNNSIENIITEKFETKCFNDFLSTIEKTKKLTSKDIAFFKTHPNIFRKSSFIDKIDNILLTTESNQQLKNIIKEFFLNKKIPLNKKLISHLELDQKLTKALQENQFYKERDSEIAHQHMLRYFKSLRSLLRKKQFTKAQTKFENLIQFYKKNNHLLVNHNYQKKLQYVSRALDTESNLNLQKDIYLFSKEINDRLSYNESIFQIIFSHLDNKRPYLATKFINSEKLIEDLKHLDSKSRYWIARSYEENGEIKTAKDIYGAQIDIRPLSYYSILSLEKLKGLNPYYGNSSLIKKKDQIISTFNPTEFGKNEFQRLNIWLKTKQSKFFKAKSKDLLDSGQDLLAESNNSLNFYQVMIKIYSENSQYIDSFKLAYRFFNNDKIEFDDQLVQILFPIKYTGLINKYKKDLDINLVYSLIRQESGFNNYATSRVGARGLMQLMPATARMYKKNLKRKELYNPKLNIKLGTRYLKYLLEKYNGDLSRTFAAYNAGEGNLKRWVKQNIFSDDHLANIEKIPFRETRQYVKLLYRNLFFYRHINGERAPASNSIFTTY